MTYRVQRSYGLGWDIWPDQPDVPAILFSFFSEWDEAQPKNLHAVFIGLFTSIPLEGLPVRFPQSAP